MPRLTSIEKGGFYEFPPGILSAVASLFTPALQMAGGCSTPARVKVVRYSISQTHGG